MFNTPDHPIIRNMERTGYPNVEPRGLECEQCEAILTGGSFFLINDEVICPACLVEDYKKSVKDYI